MCSEVTSAGLLNRYRFQPSLNYQGYTIDLWGRAALGPLDVETEWLVNLGQGDLDTGANDISVVSFGGLLRASGTLDKIKAGLEFGLASGDDDLDDENITTFTFDRDHNIALMMFEEPMPVLQEAVVNETNLGRNYDMTLTGDGISNALYFRLSGGYQLRPDLSAGLSFVGARALKMPTGEEDRQNYGLEWDLNVRWHAYDHFALEGVGGLFVPGSVYSAYTDEDLAGSFDSPCLGARVIAEINF